jgi:mRNA-degrading endonuclease YafQ of YafQ-DinJ toxin-antitoxin module
MRDTLEAIAEVEKAIESDPFHPSLVIHKLKGKLKNYYSFSVDYDYRVIFRFIDKNKVLFINIGTHDIYK